MGNGVLLQALSWQSVADAVEILDSGYAGSPWNLNGRRVAPCCRLASNNVYCDDLSVM